MTRVVGPRTLDRAPAEAPLPPAARRLARSTLSWTPLDRRTDRARSAIAELSDWNIGSADEGTPPGAPPLRPVSGWPNVPRRDGSRPPLRPTVGMLASRWDADCNRWTADIACSMPLRSERARNRKSYVSDAMSCPYQRRYRAVSSFWSIPSVACGTGSPPLPEDPTPRRCLTDAHHSFIRSSWCQMLRGGTSSVGSSLKDKTVSAAVTATTRSAGARVTSPPGYREATAPPCLAAPTTIKNSSERPSFPPCPP